ncbi:DUF4253 domain-containing protein [Taklimakanibacter albus]|uniref:DUF4253 domain-containing protein n=1 Tax=Taklimakanibacter albus TaxID=2800327 RepID=UPI001FEEB989|nr:DUF4253 domain-containing protein [Aestuariivirga sp. YIM B02566]
MTAEEMAERMRDYQRKALDKFPLKLIETTGDKALAKWQELKAAGQGSPIILAGDETGALGNMLNPFGPDAPEEPAPVDDILRLAAGIEFPADLVKQRKAESEFFLQQFKKDLAAKPDMSLPRITQTDGVTTRTLSREEVLAAMESEPEEPPLGEWPAKPEPSIGLSVARNILTGVPLPKVYVGIAPTGDGTAIPAYLRWGGWNECPAAEYHVAAMRGWRDRYGAELVGMSDDTINLRVASRPKTREEALALAREHYIYCADVIDQGFPSYSALAAYLMANDWWYFWWD